MDSKSKEKRLRALAKSIICNSDYKDEIGYLLSSLNLTEEEVIRSYVNYDIDIFAYENEIYESLAMRMVLYLHYLLKGSWHQDRQNAISEILKKVNPKTIVDMGFGAPTRYVKEYVLKERKKLVLVDLYDSAFKFSEVLLNYWNPAWKELISFRKLDMNTHDFVGNFDVYIFQDSIEHVRNSIEYLSKNVKLSSQTSHFILSLPIGPLIPAHTISWDTEKEAVEWLKKCGLIVNQSKKVFVNPEIDLFAEQLNNKFYNLIVSCSKK